MNKKIVINCEEVNHKLLYRIGKLKFNSKEEILKYLEKQIDENKTDRSI